MTGIPEVYIKEIDYENSKYNNKLSKNEELSFQGNDFIVHCFEYTLIDENDDIFILTEDNNKIILR